VDIVDRLRSPEFADVAAKYLMAEAAEEIEKMRRTICASLDCLHHDDPKQARKILEG
jgi:hypothetical protein